MSSDKHNEKGIPTPVSTASARRRGRLSRFLAGAALATAAYLWFQPTGQLNFHAPPRRRPPVAGKWAEKLFLSVPDEESAIAASRLYATKPHIAGSSQDFETAKEFLYLLQRELGISTADGEDLPIFPAGSPESQSATLGISSARKPNTWIDIYYPVMNTPLERQLQALDGDGNVEWEADLKENADDTDPEAGKYSDAVPTFHGLSAAGDVTGKLIYANYGTKDDYDKLVADGVNLTGTVVITRYGANFRGLKIKGAQEVGAAGVLVYSDPRDDGAVTVENGYERYPHGPARNVDAVQRGSVQFLSSYPGDPTTPGYPAYPNSTRTEGENIPKIPSLPISWANAKKLLDEYQGKQVRLANNVDTRVIPIWNTYGVIPGYIKDEVVVIGNHRDAWVMGAADPSSGTSSIHETIRGLGALVRKGWKPLRTIVIASWDAEEYGLIGSTEWGEDFADWIEKYVVAYFNLDGSASGSQFSVEASPLLSWVSQQSAVDIPHPTDEGRTLWDAHTDQGKYTGNGSYVPQETPETKLVDGLGVGVLGSGSDFTVFLQRIGVASMNHGFGGTPADPVYHYHSVYDSERWMEIYGDPGFYRHVAVAKHLGLLTLRVASSIVLPLNTTHYAFELESYLDKVSAIVSASSVTVDLHPLRLSIDKLKVASQTLDVDKAEAEKELIDILKKLHKKRTKWQKVKHRVRRWFCKVGKKVGHGCEHHKFGHHQKFEHHKHRIGRLPGWIAEQEDHQEILNGLSLHAGFDVSAHGCLHMRSLPKFPGFELGKAIRRVRAVNQKLIKFERGFISEEGIPDREWYRHLGVAPGKWLGYGATTLPALTESITIEKNETLAKYEVERLTRIVDGLVDLVQVP